MGNRRDWLSAPSRRRFLRSCAAAAAGIGGLAAGEGMNVTPVSGLRTRWLDLLGAFPEAIPPLEPEVRPAEPIDGIPCRHVVFRSEARGPRELTHVPAYLLVPEGAEKQPGPAIVCIHSTTQGTGKRRIVGLAGSAPDDPPDPPATSRAYGLELARWGYVTLSIDLICDGERIPEGYGRYDTRWFYEERPGWSAVGKNTWDTMRAVDYLCTLDFVDPGRIGCIGHSLGGHSTLFAAAFDGRIACAVSNGGQLSWVRQEDHWSRPPDDRPVLAYIYIPRFRPYIEHPERPVPVDFEHLMMMMTSPRPLMLQCSEGEAERDGLADKFAEAHRVYRAAGAGDRLGMFTFPGGHNFPPIAKRHAFVWLDRWLGHTPALPAIWPGKAV